MGYVEHNLMPDELVVYSTRLHFVIFMPAMLLLILGLLLVLLGAIAQATWSVFATFGGAALALIGFIALIPKLVEYFASEFAVTNRRVIVKVGLIRRRTLEIVLQKVEAVGVEQSVLGRTLGFGTIVVTGTGGTKEPFKNIADPLEFRRRVQDQSFPVAGATLEISPARSREGGANRFCTTCGEPRTDDARFCGACGRDFES